MQKRLYEGIHQETFNEIRRIVTRGGRKVKVVFESVDEQRKSTIERHAISLNRTIKNFNAPCYRRYGLSCDHEYSLSETETYRSRRRFEICHPITRRCRFRAFEAETALWLALLHTRRSFAEKIDQKPVDLCLLHAIFARASIANRTELCRGSWRAFCR